MDIHKKLTLLFLGIVALILLLSSGAIYYFSAEYRSEDFYNRLLSKGQAAARLLLEVDEVDADLLRKIQENSPQSLYQEKLLIYNYQNEKLFSTDVEKVLRVDADLLDKIRLEGEVRYTDADHEVLGFMFIDTFDRIVVIAAAKDYYGLRKMSNLRLVLALVFAGGLLIASLLGWFYAGRALRPISKVVSEVRLIGVDNLHLRIDEGENADEIGRLAATFNEMLDRLEKGFTMQKNFIANASHELRTPLTVISGQLEVLLMQPRTEAEYQRTVQSVFEDIRSLNTMSNRLLLLAQAHSETARKDMNPERIDEVAWLARAEVLKRSDKYAVDILIDEDIESEEALTVNGNAQLLKTAVLNLMDNACKYSANHHVTLSIRSEGGSLLLIFADKGIGIPADEHAEIFEPFQRASNAITYTGRGIGLSLVKRIVELHNGHISLQSAVGEGSTFSVVLPLVGEGK